MHLRLGSIPLFLPAASCFAQKPELSDFAALVEVWDRGRYPTYREVVTEDLIAVALVP